MTKLDEHFIEIDACETGRTWVAANCTTAQQCWELLAKEKRLDWLLWWLCVDGAAPAAAELARRWALRAARVHAANACEKSGILDHAATLRALPDDATCEQIEAAARAAEAAARAAWAARNAAWDAAEAAARAAWAARDAAWDAAWAAARASGATARAARAARGAAGAAARASGAARNAELDQQIADLLTLQPSAPWTESMLIMTGPTQSQSDDTLARSRQT
jgi:hypothetical protein